ncbi:LysR family transcriptional regulator [Methylophaga pinxianii]|uniref:LysR family transcriptional regulator n=1 Tax=Methylophaga pinxianii TaxID=2881052 RepID=UPI001CF2B5E9|nr:LysR family transcriptional regulator [Methylophaga pinxianii]MCB2428170.1 LysR family transcriptional regulator [Methylophaga pinxianii]UPH45941.1 LysR family transcriptional regulator [Methylophaga pinxianii]
MIERAHLRIIHALAENGSLTAAANALFLTQSALSHQIRYLEQKLEVSLWQRDGRKLRLTQAGELMLQVAQQVLPVLEQTEQTLQAYAEGRAGILRLGVECHPCYEWLKKILAVYLREMPQMDVDIVHQFQFSGMEGLLNHHIDLLVTPDAVKQLGVIYQPMFDYELVLLVAADHPLSKKTYIDAVALQHELLLTFPVAHERLDVFTQFLMPAGIHPRTKAMQSMDIMVQMVALQRGVTVLPNWLAMEFCQSLPVKAIRLGQNGLAKTLFAAIRETDQAVGYLQKFIFLGKQSN